MIIALRGHIRNSFDNNDLYKLIKKIVDDSPDTKIYIHTWHVKQANVSWRKLEKNDMLVTEEIIKNR